MASSDDRSFFATAARGTEGALRDELRELRLPRVRGDRGGVHFGGEFEHGMRACLRSRIALRILWRQGEFLAPTPEALYEGTRQIDWSKWLNRERTLAVHATVKNSGLTHSGFVAQKIKDAIVDQLRDRDGARPDVAPRDPDVRIVAHIVRNRVEISLDLAGPPLSNRGYRTEGGTAPLREHLAAAVLRISGYQPGASLLDPMCGSGTLPIEAALWSAGRAAGADRRFGFQRWAAFDASAQQVWEREEQRAVDFAQVFDASIRGSDRDPRALVRARANAERAGVSVHFERRELDQIDRLRPGTFVVTNPPYGVRLERESRWHDDFARAFEKMRGCTLAVLSPDQSLSHRLDPRPQREHTLFNGDVECRLFTWELS